MGVFSQIFNAAVLSTALVSTIQIGAPNAYGQEPITPPISDQRNTIPPKITPKEAWGIIRGLIDLTDEFYFAVAIARINGPDYKFSPEKCAYLNENIDQIKSIEPFKAALNELVDSGELTLKDSNEKLETQVKFLNSVKYGMGAIIDACTPTPTPTPK